ncbi:MAG: hypothetical protein GKR95_02645 [Gammaproteobacteria bacterium]|nr:hypothetical protein [Gammaproteobacteria bacterium]
MVIDQPGFLTRIGYGAENIWFSIFKSFISLFLLPSFSIGVGNNLAHGSNSLGESEEFLTIPDTASDQQMLSKIAGLIRQRGPHQGYFSQCSRQGAHKQSSIGNYESMIDGGVIWSLVEPIQRSWMINPNGSLREQRSAKSGSRDRVNPITRFISLFMNPDPGEIQRLFEFAVRGGPAGYQINLIPKRRLSRLLKEVTVTGQHSQVVSIHLELKRGNRFVINLSPMSLLLSEACEN